MGLKAIFVAGTDTGVGKTIVAGALVAAMRLKGHRVGVMKPVSCGGREDAHFLMRCAEATDPINIVNPIYLKYPLSPNVASRLEEKKIDLKKIKTSYKKLFKKYDVLIIEGCGGLLVPITDKFFVIDLIPIFKAQTVLVSRSGLGAINHSLLSLEALKARKIKPLGLIFNRLSSGELTIAEKTNPQVIERLSGIAALGMFPFIKTERNTSCLGKTFLKLIDLEIFL